MARLCIRNISIKYLPENLVVRVLDGVESFRSLDCSPNSHDPKSGDSRTAATLRIPPSTPKPSTSTLLVPTGSDRAHRLLGSMALNHRVRHHPCISAWPTWTAGRGDSTEHWTSGSLGPTWPWAQPPLAFRHSHHHSRATTSALLLSPRPPRPPPVSSSAQPLPFSRIIWL